MSENESVEDLIRSDGETKNGAISSPEASPISDSTIVAEGSFSSLQRVKRQPLTTGLRRSSELAAYVFWKTNLVSFEIQLEDGFYDPGRAEGSIDWEVVHSMPPISTFFNRDASGLTIFHILTSLEII